MGRSTVPEAELAASVQCLGSEQRAGTRPGRNAAGDERINKVCGAKALTAPGKKRRETCYVQRDQFPYGGGDSKGEQTQQRLTRFYWQLTPWVVFIFPISTISNPDSQIFRREINILSSLKKQRQFSDNLSQTSVIVSFYGIHTVNSGGHSSFTSKAHQSKSSK